MTAIGSFCVRFGSAVVAGYRSQIRQTIISGLWTLLKGIGQLLVAPARLAWDREFFKSALAALLIGAMVTGVFTAVTGNLRSMTPTIRRASRDAQRFVLGLILGDDALPEPEPEPTVLRIDSRKASGKTAVDAGTHEVNLEVDGRTLYSGNILFPDGGSVRVSRERGSGRTLVIEWKGEEKWLAAKTR